MPIEFTLTRRQWRTFKKDNGLTKSPMFKKADVGPLIAKLQKAAVVWERDAGDKALMGLFSAATRLQKAFAKFVKIKSELGELSRTANQQIDTWNQQLTTVTVFLASLRKTDPSKLKQKDKKNLRDVTDQFIL